MKKNKSIKINGWEAVAILDSLEKNTILHEESKQALMAKFYGSRNITAELVQDGGDK